MSIHFSSANRKKKEENGLSSESEMKISKKHFHLKSEITYTPRETHELGTWSRITNELTVCPNERKQRAKVDSCLSFPYASQREASLEEEQHSLAAVVVIKMIASSPFEQTDPNTNDLLLYCFAAPLQTHVRISFLATISTLLTVYWSAAANRNIKFSSENLQKKNLFGKYLTACPEKKSFICSSFHH